MKFVPFFVVVIVFVAVTHAGAVPADDKKTVADLDTEYQAAVKANDAATMDRILADDFILVDGDGTVSSKADLLKEARSRRLAYEHQEEMEQTVRLWGDTAVVTAKLWGKGTDGRKPFEWMLWFSDTYVRTPKGWRYAFGQASLPLPQTSSHHVNVPIVPARPEDVSTPLASAPSDHEQPLPKSNDKAAVEATVGDYEEAVQKFDFARADALLARNAKWIERSAPEAAAFGEGAGFWAKARATRVRVRNEPHDFDIHVQGDMAWVTLLVDVTMAADNEEARVLLARSETEETGKESDPGQRQWRATYTESEVLVKTSNGWRIALGHTSRLPTKPN